MLLKEWLKINKISAKHLCHEIGLIPVALSRHLHGVAKLNCKWAVAIESFTNGEVSRQEALWPEDFIHIFNGEEVRRIYPRIHTPEEIAYLKKDKESEEEESDEEKPADI